MEVVRAIGSFFTMMNASSQADQSQDVICAFLDESGKLRNENDPKADPEVVAFGGVVGTVAQVGAMSEEWSKTLNRAKLPHFSMSEAISFSGPFEGWESRTKERDELLRQLLGLTTMVARPSCAISQTQFAAMSQEHKKKLRNPTYMCFEGMVKGIVLNVPNGLITVTYDLSTHYSDQCLKLYHLMREKHDDIKKRCFMIAFADDEVVPAIQAADLLAALRRASIMRTKIPQEPIVEELIEVAHSNQRSNTFYYLGAELGTGYIDPDK